MNKNGSIEQSDAYDIALKMGITKTRSLRTHLTYMWFVSKKKKHTIFSLFYLNVMMLRLWSLCFFLLLLPWMGFMQINTTDGQLCLISILCGKSTNSQHCTAVNAVLNWRFFFLPLVVQAHRRHKQINCLSKRFIIDIGCIMFGIHSVPNVIWMSRYIRKGDFHVHSIRSKKVREQMNQYLFFLLLILMRTSSSARILVTIK